MPQRWATCCEKIAAFLADRAMWPYGIVIRQPSLTFCPGIRQAQEPAGVQALGPERPVERFDERVFGGLPRGGRPRERAETSGLGTVMARIGSHPRPERYCRGREADRATKVRPAPGGAFRAVGQLFAARFQHRCQPQDRTALCRIAGAGLSGRDIAALVHKLAEADREDAEAAFPRYGHARHGARTDL